MDISFEHSDEAYDWYNDPARDKAFFVEFCRAAGNPIDNADGTLIDDWADVAMTLFDAAR